MARDLYVTNISFEATEEDLQKLFSVAGTVNSVRLLTDPRTGQFRGSAFVRMAGSREAKEAISSLDGARLINRIISVSEARPQPMDSKDRPSQPEDRRKKSQVKGDRSRRPESRRK